MPANSDEDLTQMMQACRTIAVVGIKEGASEDAHRVSNYMQQHGYTIVPINPKLDRVLGEKASASLSELDRSVDMVNLFRAPENIPAHVEEILAMTPLPKVVWMQLGILHGAAAAELRAAGIDVVQDRCLMVEHRRLLT